MRKLHFKTPLFTPYSFVPFQIIVQSVDKVTLAKNQKANTNKTKKHDTNFRDILIQIRHFIRWVI